MLKAGATETRVNSFVSDLPLESVTVIATAKVPTAVTVPEITPALDIDRPDGSPVADHVYVGFVPEAPSAVSVYE
jgi:hypothetical protein